jgi:excisionase family DNA binding protein
MSRNLPVAERVLLRVPDAASYISMCRASINEMTRDGKIKSIKIGGRRLIVRESLDALARGEPDRAVQSTCKNPAQLTGLRIALSRT